MRARQDLHIVAEFFYKNPRRSFVYAELFWNKFLHLIDVWQKGDTYTLRSDTG